MEIFPYILLRIGGGSFENLKQLNIPVEKDFEEAYKRKQILKNEVSDLLFKDISKTNDHKNQNLLLNIKRDLFNERNLNNIDFSEIANLIDSTTQDKINKYLLCLNDLGEINKKIINKFENELPGLREILKKLSQDRSIQNGFVFSSQSLYKNIQEYLRHSGEYTKNIKKTEVSVIKYLTRTFAKTTPFSTFNNLGMGKISENTDNIFLQCKDKESYNVISNIRINNSIFAYIRNCIYKLKELYKHFYLISNPTITIQGEQYNYLINFNNIESFQKVGINPIVEYFLSIINENNRIKYSDFIEKVIKDELLDASEEEIEAYIYKLIELGFFEFDIGISGLDTGWLNKLIEYLKKVPCETESKNIILSTLSNLNEMVPIFENANISERFELSNKAYEVFSEMKKHLDGLLKPSDEKEKKEGTEENKDTGKERKEKEIKKDDENIENKENDEKKEEEKQIIKNVQYYNYDLKPETVFYEDTVLDGLFSINKSDLQNILDDIHTLLSYFQMFDMRRDEQDSMVNYFKKKYSENEPVRLLTFYEDYISHKKEEKKRFEKEKEEKDKKEKEGKEENKNEENRDKIEENVKEDGNNNSGEEKEIIPAIKERSELQKKWFDNIINIISKENYTVNNEINITDEILNESIQTIGIEKKELSNTSLGFFIQFFTNKAENDEKEVKVVLNSSFPGYGKMTSRFLHLFPDEFTNATRNWNEKFGKECILAENIDSGIMNFNLHPALMPYEINIPGGNFVLDIEKRIPISQLQIVYNSNENILQLVDENTKKIVYAFDLGFQGYGGRSELFKFLGSFSLSRLVFVYNLVNRIFTMFQPINKSFNGNNGKVTVRPRIVFNKRVILSRKDWLIPKILLPFKNQNENESEYCAKILKWRIDLGIPEEVFININSQTNVKDDKSKPKKNFSRDDRKPQYINFNNPFLIRLFEKNLEKVIDVMKVSEMLPGSEQMLKINDRKYVTEFVVQTYNY